MSIAGTFVFLVLLLLLGRFFAWRGVDVDAGADTLNRLGIGLFFPAAILLHAPDLTADRHLLALVAIPWFVIAVVFAAAVVAVRVFGVDVRTAAVVGLGSCFGNTAFIGYAIVPAFISEDALRYAVVFDQLGSFFAVSTVGVVVIAAVAGTTRPTSRQLATKVATFPPLVALVAGVTVMPQDPGADVDKALGMLAAALLPTMALAVGLRVRLAIARADRAPLAAVLVGKLIVMPAIAFGCVRFFDVGGDIGAVVVIEAGMPVMITVGALLAFNQIRKELAASMVALSLLLSMVTLPLWNLLLQR